MRNRRSGRLVAVAASALAMTLVGSTPAIATCIPEVEAEIETPALYDDDAGGNANADDPAIWLHPDDSEDSVIVATAKEGGLRAYSLSGQELQAIAAPPPPRPDDEGGRFNNVDLLYGVTIGATAQDIAVVSDRGRDTLRIYSIDPEAAEDGQAPLTDITDPAVPLIFAADLDEVNDQETVYGLGTWHDPATGENYALVSRRHKTTVALLRLIVTPSGTVTYEMVRSISLPSTFDLPNGQTWTPCLEPDEDPQVEGMVVDAQTGTLYAGQETVGIWRMRADLLGTAVLMDKVGEFGTSATYDPETEECTIVSDPGFGGDHLTADVEGLTIYYRRDGRGYLLASSQGDNTFVVYRREGANAYVGHLRIVADEDPEDPDGSEVCDGAAVLNVPLGDRFDEGLMVVQDGQNSPVELDPDGEEREKTNFKFVEWDDIAEEVGLAVDTRGWSPR